MTPEHKKWLWWAGAGIAALVVLWLIMRSTSGASNPSLNVANVGGGGSVDSLGGMGSLGISGVSFLPNGGGLSVSTSAPANSGAAVDKGHGDTGTTTTGAGSTGKVSTVASAPEPAPVYTPPPPSNPIVTAIIDKSPGGPIGPTKPTGGKGTSLQ